MGEKTDADFPDMFANDPFVQIQNGSNPATDAGRKSVSNKGIGKYKPKMIHAKKRNPRGMVLEMGRCPNILLVALLCM